MTDASLPETTREASMGDYIALLKPRVMSLVVFTALVGLIVAPVPVHPFIAFVGILCIAVGGGASAALNMWWDADIDAIMRRTKSRPIPSGRTSPDAALGLGVALSGLSVLMLGLAANWHAAAWLAFTIFFYAVIYTIWLKRITPQNIVIGGLFGAAPPLFGWAAITGTVEPGALLLVLIIFAWTPPHFWPLAIARKDEYEDIAMPMLPVTHGEQYTKWHIFFYTLIMIATTLLPFAIGMSGWLYLAAAIALGLGFLYWSVVLLLDRHPRAAMETFRYSILYLMLLFVALLVDHYLLPQFVAGALPTQWGFGA